MSDSQETWRNKSVSEMTPDELHFAVKDAYERLEGNARKLRLLELSAIDSTEKLEKKEQKYVETWTEEDERVGRPYIRKWNRIRKREKLAEDQIVYKAQITRAGAKQYAPEGMGVCLSCRCVGVELVDGFICEECRVEYEKNAKVCGE